MTDSKLYEWWRLFAPRPGADTDTPKTAPEKNEEIRRLRAGVVRMQEWEIVFERSLGILSEPQREVCPSGNDEGLHPVALLCEVLVISRSGYYRWRQRRPTQRQRDDTRLAVLIAAAHSRSRQNYGAPRIVEALLEAGTPISKRRCARLMNAGGLQGRKKHRRRRCTTDSRHAHPPAENLLAATAAPTSPNQACVTDITYIETGESWLYLAAILDVWSRRVVGWTCGPTLHVSLVLTTLELACANENQRKGCCITPTAGSNMRATTTPTRWLPPAWFAA